MNAPDTLANETALRHAIQRYFNALYDCDTAILDDVFHPSASLFDADGGRIFAEPIAWYRDTILRRLAPAETDAPRRDEILVIDFLGPVCANVKVRVRIHDKVFLDHLHFARDGRDWRIVGKLWTLEKVIGA